jgi:predicted metal-dependent HD superfamily phosphohydrolase
VPGDALELAVAWQRHLGADAAAVGWRDRVLAMYDEGTRHYHDRRHVCWVVRHIATIAADHPVNDLDAVVAAGFFHDAIYDITRHDNERASADLAATALDELGWEPDRIEHVAAMIEATAGHELAGVDHDTAVLLAADLAVLAAEPARYLDYVAAVRREYASVDDDGWRQGRGAVLRALLDRSHLFAPELTLDTWERRARANLTAELATLT